MSLMDGVSYNIDGNPESLFYSRYSVKGTQSPTTTTSLLVIVVLIHSYVGFYIVANALRQHGRVLRLVLMVGSRYFDEISIGSEGVVGYLTAPLDTHPHWYQDKLNTVTSDTDVLVTS